MKGEKFYLHFSEDDRILGRVLSLPIMATLIDNGTTCHNYLVVAFEVLVSDYDQYEEGKILEVDVINLKRYEQSKA